MTIGFRHSDQPVGTSRVGERLQRAYTLLETARIRCRQLTACEPMTARIIDSIHCDLGLAGFYGSEEMEPDIRRSCLARAHHHSDTPGVDRPRALRRIFEETRSAADALGETLSEAPSDHIHVAYLYALSALESLDIQVHAAAT